MLIFLSGEGEENEVTCMTVSGVVLIMTVSLFLKDIVSMFQSSFKKGVTEANFLAHYRYVVEKNALKPSVKFVPGWMMS